MMIGALVRLYGVTFIEKGTENKLRPNAYKVECVVCKDGGNLFDFRIKIKK